MRLPCETRRAAAWLFIIFHNFAFNYISTISANESDGT